MQTINNGLNFLNLSPDYFDYIVIDECHHLIAKSYREIIKYFNPKVLLGLTATPERMDCGDIQEDFHNKIWTNSIYGEVLTTKTVLDELAKLRFHLQ